MGVRAPEPPAAPPFAKASAFLARFTAWRELLRLGSLTQCLERVLAETHYESLLLAEPRGSGRVANVRRLLDLARQFDPYQRQGLHRFLQFIAAQEEAELDHAPAPAPTDNAVRLMSIHQSKGLEFPVVVVAGLGTMFNERDLRGDILLDEEFGLCPMVSPPGRERRYASLPHWLARRRGRRELLGEELRLLYVALTRARDTLLLVGTASGRDVVEKWRGPAAALNDLALLKARRPLDWLRLWLPGVTRDEDWRGDVSGRNELLSWDFYTADDERLRREGRDSVEPSNERSEASASSMSGKDATREESRFARASSVGRWGSIESHPAGDLERLRAKLDWFYPHTPATHELAKTSVTVLRRRAAEADEEAGHWFRPRGVVAPRVRGGLTATQVGLAHHAFLQGVDIGRTATALDLRNEAARLTDAGVLTERESAALDFAALLDFWESPVGKQVRENERSVQREVPFTARFTVAELAAMGLMGSQKSEVRSQEPGQRSLAGGGISAGSHEGAFSLPRRRGKGDRRPDEGWGSPTPTPVTPHPSPLPSSDEGRGSPGAEFVIVQGVADLVVFGAREIWLLDYKTDHFDAAELPAKVREHGPQLTLYALALERIYGKKVTRTWLHFLALGRTELL
ncbi:MAG: PD-(D/E)XK nuclease family protein [Verrucomicrobia bacterium]|nr:PD-(D/E)XK nuclease family protein [Verrucomicrobiota bacterium]